nr:pilin [Cupriavidus campinensis]
MQRVQQIKKLGRQAQKGFTLIELMIVVAIIGILAAIAIPQYQDYVAKSQMARAVSELSAYKTAIEDRINQGAATVSDAEVGYVQSNLLAPATLPFAAPRAIAADGSMNYVGTIGGQAQRSLAGATITISRAAGGAWTCAAVQGAATSWKASYAPAGCP